MRARAVVYEDAAGEYRWHRVAGNGEVTADSSEGYTKLSDAVEAAERENPGLEIVIRPGLAEP